MVGSAAGIPWRHFLAPVEAARHGTRGAVWAAGEIIA